MDTAGANGDPGAKLKAAAAWRQTHLLSIGHANAGITGTITGTITGAAAPSLPLVPAMTASAAHEQPFRKMAPLFAELLEHWATLSAGAPNITVAQLHLLACSWHMHLGLQPDLKSSDAENSAGAGSNGDAGAKLKFAAAAGMGSSSMFTGHANAGEQSGPGPAPLASPVVPLSATSYHEVYGRPRCRGSCTYHDDSADRLVRGYNEVILPDIAQWRVSSDAGGRGAPALAAPGVAPFSRASAADVGQGGANVIVCED